MAYDRYDTRDDVRVTSARDGRRPLATGRDRGGRDDRGFFERAGDEIASWFGDDDAERRRHEDQMREDRERGHGRAIARLDRGDDRDHDRDRRAARPRLDAIGTAAAARSERDYNPGWRREFRGRDRERTFATAAIARDRRLRPRRDRRSRPRIIGRSRAVGDVREPWPRRISPHQPTPARAARRATATRITTRWRERQLSELDRDYDDYRRENQSRFESDFGSWRETAAAEARPARPDPRAYGSGRQRRPACRHRRQRRRRPHHPDQVGSGQRRRASFAELLGHRPGRRRSR